jgi:hypothetical protein
MTLTKKMNFYSSGETYTTDENGKVEGSRLYLIDRKLFGKEDFVAFCVEQSKIKNLIKEQYSHEIEDKIERQKTEITYIITGKKDGMIIFYMTFNFKTHGYFKKKTYSIEVDALIKPEYFNYSELKELKTKIENDIRAAIIEDQVVKKTDCSVTIKTNVK